MKYKLDRDKYTEKVHNVYNCVSGAKRLEGNIPV